MKKEFLFIFLIVLVIVISGCGTGEASRQLTKFCFDSDGGKNYAVKGNVIYECKVAEELKQEPIEVQEKKPAKLPEPIKKTRTFIGRAMEMIQPKTESIKIEAEGKAYLCKNVEEDSCYQKEENLLMEYYCDNGKVKSDSHNCKEGEVCKGGACVASCGNGKVESNEKCDGANLTGATCANLGKGTGTLKCSKDCKTFDDSGCITLEQAYGDEKGDGALTDYARSFAPKMLTLNLQELPKLYPEKYGKNYFIPGTYKIHEGDGFGKGNFLIKFVEFVPSEFYIKDNVQFLVEGTGIIYFEVFKKESDGNYYPFPTSENYVVEYSIKDLFNISFESLNDKINMNENTLIYHPNCSIFYNYCKEQGNYWYALDSSMCNWRCAFEPAPGEQKYQQGIFSAIFPEAYSDILGQFLQPTSKYYENNIGFLGYNPEKPRIGIKILVKNDNSGAMGLDEFYQISFSKYLLDSITPSYFNFDEEFPQYLIRHELTHTLTKAILGENYGLNEGLANFVTYHQTFRISNIHCSENGYYVYIPGDPYTNTEETAYADLSKDPSQLGGDYYITGFCFWTDLVKEYGYPKFVEIMQKLYTKGRGIDDYYVLDVIEKVIGGPISDEIIKRYSLTKEATKVEICNGCEMFIN